ncbi:hypothetical protein [Luteibacter yeojuensis]|uniref:Uncharacterized protein n=1 Tax=Luteibacter yeojuensis TaxID=345309 RepID=A0A0F3L1U1_9GAMM|nr:hypothetical protein [Luteibacter yeojuensis]KJV36319.1 hypothetical protein VI08_05575 [Luteibacter yeojuensis]
MTSYLTRKRRCSRRTRIACIIAFELVVIVVAYLVGGWATCAIAIATAGLLAVIHGLVVLATAILMAKP